MYKGISSNNAYWLPSVKNTNPENNNHFFTPHILLHPCYCLRKDEHRLDLIHTYLHKFLLLIYRIQVAGLLGSKILLWASFVWFCPYFVWKETGYIMGALDNYFCIWRDKHPYSKYYQKYAELHLSECIRSPLIIHYGKRYVFWFHPGQDKFFAADRRGHH